jgi:hypothetical protein
MVGDEQFKDVSKATLLIWTSLLRALAIAGLVYGLIIVAWALLSGPSRAAIWIRRRLALGLNASAGVVWGVGAGIFLLLFLWSPTPAFRSTLRLLVLAALYAAGIAALRRQTLAEFPEARAHEPAV